MDEKRMQEFLDKRQKYRQKYEELEKEIAESEKHAKHWEEEGERIYSLLDNPEKIIRELSEEFERHTSLDKSDIKFLFLATALQVFRITVINNLTKIEKAGSGNRNEEALHSVQDKIFEEANKKADLLPEKEYYAAKKHILGTHNVPYDATAFADEKLPLFKGANHRFATLGHDPVLGLIFGTANIMTNTITCVRKSDTIGTFIIPQVTTNHVIYNKEYKYPKIGMYGSTSLMLGNAVQRAIEEPSVLVIALLKQLIHIGTDLYTPCGIQIPAANLVLSNTNVEAITRVISTGDILKIGVSGNIANMINQLIATLHLLTYEEKGGVSQEVFSVKTKKIIIYSNIVATHSNVIYALLKQDLKVLDIGGLIVTIHRIVKDAELIQEIRNEFVYGGYEKQLKLKNFTEEEKGIWI